MKREGLKAGLKKVMLKVVKEGDVARLLKGHNIEVLATPVMIAWMEEASWKLVEEFLEDDEVTVGVSVSVSHKAPAPLGSEVLVEATLKEVEGRRLKFEVCARLGDVIIGEGVHERFVVNLSRFKERVESFKRLREA